MRPTIVESAINIALCIVPRGTILLTKPLALLALLVTAICFFCVKRVLGVLKLVS